MNTDGRRESSVSEDSEFRIKDSQGIKYSSVDLDVDPFQRLKRHFSLNNRSDSVDKKIKVPSSYYEKSLLATDFQDENSFDKALAAAKICLEEEELSKETADHFYSLIQSVAKHARYVKKQNEDSIQKVNRIKFDLIKFTSKALDICDKIKTILNLSYTEKLWNHLTESQKEGIDNFQKLFNEICKQLNENCVLYVDTNTPVASMASSSASEEASCISHKREQLQQLLAEKNKLLVKLATVKEKHAKLSETNTDVASPPCQNRARLIAILSPFLYVHRLCGQSVAEISSYLEKLGYCISEQEIEHILTSYPSVFRECNSSEGQTGEKQWIFSGCDI